MASGTCRFLCILPTLLLGISLSGQSVEKLSGAINTNAYDEITPVLSYDGLTLYFTRVGAPDFVRVLKVNGENVYAQAENLGEQALRKAFSQLAGVPVQNVESSDFNQDVWVATSEKDFFDQVQHPPAPLNNALPNSICSVTPEPNRFIINNQFPAEGGMQSGFSEIYQREDGSWLEPVPISIENFYNNSNNVNLTMSRDGQVLIMSLEREDSRGQNDLYISFRKGNNKWSEPRNMGSLLNSSGLETNPSLSQDMMTLYFSSDRPGSEGVDIYYSEREDKNWKKWSIPRKLSFPINSSADESQPHFNSATGYLYFSSNRDGSSDIFRYPLEAPMGQETVLLMGEIKNSQSEKPMPVRIIIESEDPSVSPVTYYSVDGKYRLQVPKGAPVHLRTQKDGYIELDQVVEFDPEVYYFKEQRLDLQVDPIEVNSLISLGLIYFERSKPDILPESFAQLDHLVKIMQDLPELKIQIEGHTDDQGDFNSLLQLSEDRAKRVKEYLTRKGIAGGRIQTKGYGASRPVNNNRTEEERRQNRRVEVRIIAVDH